MYAYAVYIPKTCMHTYMHIHARARIRTDTHLKHSLHTSKLSKSHLHMMTFDFVQWQLACVYSEIFKNGLCLFSACECV
jgi:hypothetical protein